jgi:hypothetical protein
MAHLTAEPEALYYIRDSRSNTGNCVMWWQAGGLGYTSDLNYAGRFSLEFAILQHRNRNTDMPYRIDDVSLIARRTVDFQDLRHIAAITEKG